MTIETVVTFLAEITVGRTAYTADITIEMDNESPYTIAVTAHYDGLRIVEILVPERSAIGFAHRTSDCLRIVRDHKLVMVARDKLAAAIGKVGHTLS